MYREIAFLEKELGEQRLVSCKILNPIQIDHVEVEMLKNNKINGLLPFSTVQNNDDIDFVYEITNKITLAQFLGGIVRWEELYPAIREIVEILNDCEQFMLSENHFVLDANAIFVNKVTRKPELIFLPIEDDFAEKITWKDFLLLLLHNLNYDERDDMSKYELLSGFLADEKITIKQYVEKIKKIENSSVLKTNVKEQETTVKEIPKERMKNNVIYNVPMSGDKSNADVVKTQIEKNKKDNNKLSLFSKKKKKEKKNSSKKEESFAFDIPGQKRSPFSERKKIINDVQEIEETVLDEAGGVSLFMPYLVHKETNQQILINKKDFKIGREEQYVDYVTSEPTVGRLHASVVLDEQGKCVYVRDANSKNGTFVNGEKIQSNINIQVEDGTVIRFGRDEYVVRLN